MNLLRMNPWREVRDVQSTINRLFGDARCYSLEDAERSFTEGRWTPLVDVYETDNDLVFSVGLPGVEKDQVDISVDGGHLMISGEKKFTEHEDRQYHRVDHWYGDFQRNFQLPNSINSGKISANLKNGVLTVTLPKKAEAKPKQISVSAQ